MTPLTLNLNFAGVEIGLDLQDRVVAALPLCRDWFAGFFAAANKSRFHVHVACLDIAAASPEFRRRMKLPVTEALLPVAELVKELPQCRIDPSKTSTSMAARCFDGLLLFDSASGEGRIWLTNPGSGRFRPLHRLLWMYFAMALGDTGRFFVHCAAVESAGKAYLFWGESGAGKSTVAALLKDARLLSDDGPILARRGDAVVAYPSPFRQQGIKKHQAFCDPAAGAEIAGFYFLEKDRRLYLQPTQPQHAFAEILRRHVHFFDYLSSAARAKAFEMLHAAVASLPQYRLHFPRHAHLWPLLKGGSNQL